MILLRIIIVLLSFLLFITPSSDSFASAKYEVLTVPTVSANAVSSLGTFRYKEEAFNILKKGDEVTFSLPSGLEFRQSKALDSNIMIQDDWIKHTTDDAYYIGNEFNYLRIPKISSDTENGLNLENLIVEQLNTREIKVKLQENTDQNKSCTFYVYLGAIYIKKDFSSDIVLMADSGINSNFIDGSMVVGRAHKPEITISMADIKSFYLNNVVLSDLRILEDTIGALVPSTNSVELTLPEGFTWDVSNVSIDLPVGQSGFLELKDLTLTQDNRTFLINISEPSTQNRVILRLIGLTINKNEDLDLTGPIICQVAGASSFNKTSIIIAEHYRINTDPEDSTSDVLLNKIISIRFSKNIEPGNNYSNIKLTNEKNEDVPIIKTIKCNELNLEPENELEPGEKYSVYIPSEAISSFEEYNFSFTTGQADVVVEDECFIATAAYGSKFEPSVNILRSFRDKYLLTSSLGTSFVKFYYANSPTIAKVIANNEALRLLTRVILIPFVMFSFLALHPLLTVLALIIVAIGYKNYLVLYKKHYVNVN